MLVRTDSSGRQTGALRPSVELRWCITSSVEQGRLPDLLVTIVLFLPDAASLNILGSMSYGAALSWKPG